MIRIERPAEPPPSLKRWGEIQTTCDRAEYKACPHAYDVGVRKFPEKFYYRSSRVKTQLVEIHHCKCCYCEQGLHPDVLHVEHFRPKRGFRQALRQKTDEWPGYYWLAYQWDNLLLACPTCNSTYKRTFFPLANPKKRARSHCYDVGQEKPLLIDPAREDPRRHIRYENEVPMGVTKRGRETIKGIGLDRSNLREDRLHAIAHIEARFTITEAATKHTGDRELQAKAAEASAFIESAVQPHAEFSSMAIDYLARRRI